ncbi:MAG: hypothetical protein KAI47_11210, partial [Deltaproteobacteria bacterium]|nr:hypothetical protein [Deltaproteobacteria bacterium]
RAETYYQRAASEDPNAEQVQRRLAQIHDRPQRVPSPRKPRHAPRSRPRSTPQPPPPPRLQDDSLFEAMRTQPIQIITNSDERKRRATPPEPRPLPPKKKT